jgi:signal transduction histidine kinase
VAERLLIAGLRAHERVEESEAACARLAFLLKASHELALSLEPETVLQTIVNLVVPELADGATLYTSAAEDRPARVTSATSDVFADRTPEWWSWFERVTRQVVEHALLSGTSQLATASAKHTRTMRFAEPLVSYLVVPIHARGRPIGALRMLSLASRRTYGSDEVGLAEAYCSQVSLALENAWLYAARLALVAHLEDVRSQLDVAQTEWLRDDERRRIARDLHDHVEQSFFAIGLTAAAALDVRHEPNMNELADALRHVSQLSTSGAEQLRSAIFALKHADVCFSAFGLVSSLRGVVYAFQRRTGVEADLVVTGTGSDVPDDVSEMLHAVACEALANTERHAHASSVVLKLQLQPRSVALSIMDDGVGAPTLVLQRLASSALHFGLAGLKERVRRLRGSFKAGPGANGGFVVRTRLPLPEQVISA